MTTLSIPSLDVQSTATTTCCGDMFFLEEYNNLCGYIHDAFTGGCTGAVNGSSYCTTTNFISWLYQTSMITSSLYNYSNRRKPLPRIEITDRKTATLVDKVDLPPNITLKDIHVDVQLATECAEQFINAENMYYPSDIIQFDLVLAAREKVQQTLQQIYPATRQQAKFILEVYILLVSDGYMTETNLLIEQDDIEDDGQQQPQQQQVEDKKEEQEQQQQQQQQAQVITNQQQDQEIDQEQREDQQEIPVRRQQQQQKDEEEEQEQPKNSQDQQQQHQPTDTEEERVPPTNPQWMQLSDKAAVGLAWKLLENDLVQFTPSPTGERHPPKLCNGGLVIMTQKLNCDDYYYLPIGDSLGEKYIMENLAPNCAYDIVAGVGVGCSDTADYSIY